MTTIIDALVPAIQDRLAGTGQQLSPEDLQKIEDFWQNNLPHKDEPSNLRPLWQFRERIDELNIDPAFKPIIETTLVEQFAEEIQRVNKVLSAQQEKKEQRFQPKQPVKVQSMLDNEQAAEDPRELKVISKL
ncbi:MAG: hypothetical protein V3V61_00155 [Gammaproteobacteria bacterium]